MLIRFAGPMTKRRIYGPYVFGRLDGMVQEVDAETAAGMLTHPGDQFEVDKREPLLGLKEVNAEVVGLLAFEGIRGVEDMAGLTTREAGKLAKALGREITREQVKGWVEEARWLLENREAELLELAELVGGTEQGLEKRGCCG